ncbi:BadF/BadG/BcrA/BcrD ATPase family protein [Pseudochelatococcus contaminans]|uniref:Glucosamine kinase n=1 Tax=Pseudochelatococcus contaminans TaxID=1538103 RepID=A0A7W5Z3Y8_9HYPH|nr:BadF/BadG/BcrA/BcrD ATPase family protein [Pseudochelatococcus contaminans]MBB3809334.1 glucosamine kinase [Pseudochelatococcus contaminans]
MAVRYFLGIDGGGTGCRARLRDEAGRMLGEGKGGPANARLDTARVRQSILDAAGAALRASGLDGEIWQRTHAGFGLAGAGQTGACERLLALPFPFADIAVDTDAYTSWLGASLGNPEQPGDPENDRGAILIVGTGICGFTVLGGERISIGGWGFPVSDDGSGAVTGREAVRQALRAHDGLAPASPLAEAVLADIGPTPEQVVDWADKTTPADYARFAPLVYAHAATGDPLARLIATQAAGFIDDVARRLLTLGAARIHLLGGLAGTVQPWLAADVQQALSPARGDALDGAIALAHASQTGSADNG